MTPRRDLAWRHFDSLQKSSVAYRFAEYALGLGYESLPQEVAHQAKRCLLDALGCAIGGYEAPGRPICEDVVRELGGLQEATVFGSGLRTSASNATLVNSFMVRFLDFNDMGGGAHNSDSISSIVAVGERERATGRDILTSVVVSYELGTRVSDAPASWGGWNSDTRAGLIVPPALGRLMGLTTEQIANAIGICASGNFTLGILDIAGEERVMRKNLRFGWGASAAVMACLLAKKGYTGPVRVVEGERGLNEVLFKNKLDFERLTDFRGWRIMRTRFKYLCANSSLQGLLNATIQLVKEHDLKPEDIAEAHIKMHASASAIRPSVPLTYPRNAETADHSAFFLTAIAIRDREMTPASIDPANFTDPVVLDLLEKISVEGDPSLSSPGNIKYALPVGNEGKAEIVTKDGRRLQKHVVIPHGFWGGDTLTDQELEEKFAGMAARRMDQQQIQKIIQTVWGLDALNDIGVLTELMVFKKR